MSVRTFHTLETWPRELVLAVGQAYRQNGAEGTLEPAGWHRIRDAYLAAGGDPETVATTPNKIIAVLCRVHPDWMHGPTRRRVAEEEAMALAARRRTPLG
ncbi:hypothetical protein J5Y09_04165 [Roseomonas sp. PWR1]|uniref:Uncharacterized protein n=1 Tax=Roseomonas nitratireducens TaxID=2820810 RepID=A0ABS4AP07_9PROT|nr:hypothetical protein [Neoroseomonas nitratireducens]MBP0463096.1 hypothetical protein [Neoroseomonas nitratireducens]